MSRSDMTVETITNIIIEIIIEMIIDKPNRKGHHLGTPRGRADEVHSSRRREVAYHEESHLSAARRRQVLRSLSCVLSLAKISRILCPL